jgi:predicted nucleotidyltransferase
MEIEQKLVQHLVQKYNPRAMLIHGSRAEGFAREHSDWDFAIFVDKEIEGDREIIEGQNVEVRVLVLPFDENKIGDRWLVVREGNIKVVYDPENILEGIIEKVTTYYNQPLIHTEADISGHRAWYRSQLDGMIDYQNEQEAFFRKLAELYMRTIRYWFNFKHNTYMPQVYLSLPRIEKEDPEHFKLLQILAGNHTNAEKIGAAEKAIKSIWG